MIRYFKELDMVIIFFHYLKKYGLIALVILGVAAIYYLISQVF